MNNTKRTATLDSLIIKKLRHISIESSNPNSSVDTHTETTAVKLNQHAISSNINEMTTYHCLVLKIIVHRLKTIVTVE